MNFSVGEFSCSDGWLLPRSNSRLSSWARMRLTGLVGRAFHTREILPRTALLQSLAFRALSSSVDFRPGKFVQEDRNRRSELGQTLTTVKRKS